MKEISKIVNTLIQGNCVTILKDIPDNSVNTIYLDPPFCTQKEHRSMNHERNVLYSFNDKFKSLEEYLDMLRLCLTECKRVLQADGSLFLHCDKTASHYLRQLLDEIFGKDNFINEIIWAYKRWSNSKKGLQNTHQVIFYYGKTSEYKFNTIYTDYSPTTNIDQILQERVKDEYGKSVYKKDEDGNIVKAKKKEGVPLSDVWEIPFLNPKAKERTGYPTQKPVALLKRILEISTSEGDIVLDPFCGSGTTCVAAKSMNRKYIGIDISEDAISLAEKRLEDMIISDSQLMKKGKEAYIEKGQEDLTILKSLNAVTVQRNSLIDGYIKDSLIPITIQKENDTIDTINQRINQIYFKYNPNSLIFILKYNIKDMNIIPEKWKSLLIIKTLSAQLYTDNYQ